MKTLRQISDRAALRALCAKDSIIERVQRDGQELTVSFMTAVDFVADGHLDEDRAERCPRPCFFKTVELRLDCGSEIRARVFQRKLGAKL